jgi:hypothetical protein
VKIARRNDGWLQTPTTFEIQVTQQGISFAVERRYNEFVQLEEQLRPQLPHLPPMPPKSLVIRRLNPNFLDARQKLLGELLDAALEVDPMILIPALRVFLGLDKDMSDAWTECSTDSEDMVDAVATSSYQCAEPGCMMRFDDERSFECHMKFAHLSECQVCREWEVVPDMNFVRQPLSPTQANQATDLSEPADEEQVDNERDAMQWSQNGVGMNFAGG